MSAARRALLAATVCPHIFINFLENNLCAFILLALTNFVTLCYMLTNTVDYILNAMHGMFWALVVVSRIICDAYVTRYQTVNKNIYGYYVYTSNVTSQNKRLLKSFLVRFVRIIFLKENVFISLKNQVWINPMIGPHSEQTRLSFLLSLSFSLFLLPCLSPFLSISLLR